jgi:acyl carrier protein
MTDETTKRVLAILEEDICETVTADSPFESLEIDSLDYLNFIVHVETAFDVSIPGAAVAEFETPAAVAAWIEADACA